MIDILRKVALFEDVDERELEPLANIVVARSYPKNAIIVSEGEESRSMFFVLAGRLKAFVSDDNLREKVLTVMGPGDYFGEMMLDGGPRSASVMALEPAKLGILSRDRFQEFLSRHPDSAFALIRHLIRRTRALTESVKDLALMDVYGRLAKLLLSLAREEDGKLVIDEKLTKQQIGDRIGASREMVTRVLKDLAAGGYVSEEKGRLVIHRRPPARW